MSINKLAAVTGLLGLALCMVIPFAHAATYELGFQRGKRCAVELIGSHIYAHEPKFEKLNRGEIRNDLTLAAKL